MTDERDLPRFGVDALRSVANEIQLAIFNTTSPLKVVWSNFGILVVDSVLVILQNAVFAG